MAETPRAGERRHLTVLFYDLVGSTAIATASDPEELHAALDALHRAVGTAIAPHRGFVARYMGDGAIVYFGYPVADEDDTERAVLAALAARDAAATIRLPDGNAAAIRIGIATGLVVMGRVGAQGADSDVSGATAHLAARLQSAADPGGILISRTTRDLVGGLFALEPLAPQAMRGYTQPEPSWRVLGRAPLDSRFEAIRRRYPLVGRDADVAALDAAWQRAIAGSGQALLLVGDPGIGKSRLVAELKQHAGDDPLRLEYFCLPSGAETPLLPYVRQLRRAAGIEEGDGTDVCAAKLAPAFHPATTADDRALIAGITSPAPRAAPLDPQHQRRQSLAALRRQLDLLATARPVLLIVEDVHWCDPTSRELLALLIQTNAPRRALILVTSRPAAAADWALPGLSPMPLTPLDGVAALALARRVTAGRPIPAPVASALITRADGIPLFIEELTLAWQEQDNGALPTAAIPSSLHDLLAARIDRLGDARPLAQAAAAIGRDFTVADVAGVAGLSIEAATTELDRMMASGLLAERGETNCYGFRHALIRDAAYSGLLRAQRQQLHASLHDSLLAGHPTLETIAPERLAVHAAEAGMAERAATLWLAAGRQAMAAGAMVEAADRLRNGLKAVAGSEAFLPLELALTLALGKALIATRGYAATETGATFARAASLHRGDPRDPLSLSILHGLWTHELLHGDLATARQRAERLLATSADDPLATLMGHRFAGVTAFPMGHLAEGRRHLEAVVARFDPEQRSIYAQITIDDTRVVATVYLSWILAWQGDRHAAAAHAAAATAEALALAQPYSVAHALTGSALVDLMAGRFEPALKGCDDLERLARDHGIAYYAAVCRLFRGRALCGIDCPREGAALLAQGLEAYAATQSRLYEPTFRIWLGLAHADLGDHEAALACAEEALRIGAAMAMRLDDAAAVALQARSLSALGRSTEERGFLAMPVVGAGRVG